MFRVKLNKLKQYLIIKNGQPISGQDNSNQQKQLDDIKSDKKSNTSCFFKFCDLLFSFFKF